MEIKNLDRILDYDSRNYRLLLYPDNPEHLKTFRIVQRHKYYRDNYIFCYHVLYDVDGREIVVGHGKKHCHVLLDLPSAKEYHVVLSQLAVEPQFCWPMKYQLVTEKGITKFKRDSKSSLQKGFEYLLHLNAPDKTQYSVDSLHGSRRMVQAARLAVAKFNAKQITEAEALVVLRKYLQRLDTTVSFGQLLDVFGNTPYYKAIRSPCGERLRCEHNARFYQTAIHRDNDERNQRIMQSSGGVAVGSAAVRFGNQTEDDAEQLFDFRHTFEGSAWWSSDGQEPPF